MTDYIYDIETFPNIFTCVIKEANTQVNIQTFEISTRRNDTNILIDFLSFLRNTDARMVGFNNIHFDYPILHYIIHKGIFTPHDIYNFATNIINSKNKFLYTIWDNDRYVKQVDLFKIHHFDNVAKFTSLKILEFNMKSENIIDLPFSPGTVIPEDQFHILLKYNLHDVTETEKFYNHSSDAIKFREYLSEKHNRNFINHNDTKLGKDYFIMELEKINPDACYHYIEGKRQPRQSWRSAINIKDIILPYIKFRHPELNKVLSWLKLQRITETKGIFKGLTCTINDFKLDFGTGGIHGSLNNTTVISTDDKKIIDIDVTSYYPSLAISNQLYPEHLGKAFCHIYEMIKYQRLTYKKGTPENSMLKLALNGVFGDTNNRYSPFYDPSYTMAITINGQLLLCILIEYMMDIPGLKMIQANTDGITIQCPVEQIPRVKYVCEWWEQFTCLQLETNYYSKMFIRDVNNYLAIDNDGNIKRKGAYEYELEWHKNHSALIIPKAAEAFLLNNTDIRTFIHTHADINDFMLRTKVPKSSYLLWVIGNIKIKLQNVTRYYISTIGGELHKMMPPLKNKTEQRKIGVNVGYTVTEHNELKPVDRSNINYNYYITEAKKLISLKLI